MDQIQTNVFEKIEQRHEKLTMVKVIITGYVYEIMNEIIFDIQIMENDEKLIHTVEHD